MANAPQTKAENKSGVKSFFAAIVIPLSILVCVLLYLFVLGNPANFEGGDPNNHPLPGNFLGIVYKGGYIVPVLMSLLLMAIIFSIERFLTINKASGRGSIDAFIRKIQMQLTSGNIDGAMAECDKQQGSVANVIKSSLVKYRNMEKEVGMDREQKVLAIQKEIEEATSLEMPMLEKNLIIVATLVSIGTLIGLLGTVIGMIRAFAALATAGAPDSVALANGISEALINTALGILTSTVALIAYNYFTSKIDKLTYSIDEAGFSIIQTYASSHSK